MKISLDRLNKEFKEVFSSIENGDRNKLEDKVSEYKKESNAPFNKLIQGDEYPDPKFRFTKSDYSKLKNFYSNRYSSQATANELEMNPINKLLYAMVWKQGDLEKMRTIIEGIEEALEIPEENRIKHTEEYKASNYQSLVFPQFGKFLVDPVNYPIVDQHVIRAFKTYREVFPEGLNRTLIDQIREDKYNNNVSINIINFDDITIYTNWLKNETNLENHGDTFRLVDKCLFTLGKAIKSKRVKIN